LIFADVMKHNSLVMSSLPRQTSPKPPSPKGPTTTSELQAQGHSRAQITRMVRAGRLLRISRGLYAWPGRESGVHAALVDVAARVPNGVFCLLSALRFHELTTQAPFQVWLAIAHKARAPKIDWPPLRLVRVAPAKLTLDTDLHTVEGVELCVTNVARTVVDCFKHRNKIGLDVAREALLEAWLAQCVDMDSLWRVAKSSRQANVMRPHLEALG